MLFSGFTFIRNALKYDFPIEEAIRSFFPLVDELVINVGISEDGTEEFIQKIVTSLKEEHGDKKEIRILTTRWNDAQTDSGLVLSEQTNIALDACRAPWAVYLQADEALHEEEWEQIRSSAATCTDNSVEGFSFRYLHFYAGYELIQRPWNWYPREIRIVRTGKDIRSFGDAQTFRRKDGSPLKVVDLPQHVFHYGHAREPEKMKAKINYFHRFWHGDNHKKDIQSPYKLDWKNFVWYWGTHPKAYLRRIQLSAWSPRPFDKNKKHAPSIKILGMPESKLRKSLENRYKGSSLDQNFNDYVYFIDLDAETRSFLSLIFLRLRHCLRKCVFVAHSPQGKLSPLKRKFYHYISWGCHEKSELGFVVPESQYEEQLAKWIPG